MTAPLPEFAILAAAHELAAHLTDPGDVLARAHTEVEALRTERDSLRQQIEVDSDYEALLRDERDHLAGQLDKVRELHKPVRGMGGQPRDGGDYGYMFPVCSSCGTASEYGTPWPCPTILAIDGAES